MARKKDKVSRLKNSNKNIIVEEEEQTPQLTKKHKASWWSSSMEETSGEQGGLTPRMSKKRRASSHDSMEEVIGDLDGNASSPELPLALQEANHEGSTGKKKRGPTKSLKTDGIGYEDRVKVTVNELGQPIGCNRATLSTYLGTLARNAHFAPLIYTSWKGLKGSWDDMWQAVLQKFDLEEHAKKWVLSTICSSWRSHKCRLKKKYFKENMTIDYNFKNGPPNVPLEQWKLLVKFWKSNFAKERSKKNKISRAKLTTMHTTGSKTFAEIRHEEAMKNPDGRELSRVEMYLMTHKPKDSNSMNEETRRIMLELEDLMALHPKELEQGTTQDDLFSKIMGKDRHGHVRTYGKGVVASDLWGTRSILETQKKIEEVKRKAEAEMQIMQEEMQEKMKEQVEAMKLEILGGFKSVLTEVQKSYPGAKIPDLSSIFISNITRGEAIDTPSSATAHHAISKKGELIPENLGSKKGEKDKPHKKRRLNEKLNERRSQWQAS